MNDPKQQKDDKDDLELAQLKRNNSRIYLVIGLGVALVPILTFLITTPFSVLTYFNGQAKERESKEKERELKERELAQQIDTQFGAEINKLFSIIKEKEMLASEAALTLDKLSALIDKRYKDANERQNQRKDIASRLFTIFNEDSYDFRQTSRVQFELKALEDWAEYAALLQEQVRHLPIISKYVDALYNLSDEERPFVATARLDPERFIISSSVRPHNEINGRLLTDLSDAYFEHGKIFVRSLEENPGKLSPDNVQQIICGYYGATRNKPLTWSVVEPDEKLREQVKACLP